MCGAIICTNDTGWWRCVIRERPLCAGGLRRNPTALVGIALVFEHRLAYLSLSWLSCDKAMEISFLRDRSDMRKTLCVVQRAFVHFFLFCFVTCSFAARALCIKWALKQNNESIWIDKMYPKSNTVPKCTIIARLIESGSSKYRL